MDALRVLLNVVWLVLQGWILALAYLVAGVIACLLVVTIPFGIASFRLAAFVVWPFGRTTVRAPGAGLPSAVGLFPLGKRVVESAPPRDWLHAGSGVVHGAPMEPAVAR